MTRDPLDVFFEKFMRDFRKRFSREDNFEKEFDWIKKDFSDFNAFENMEGATGFKIVIKDGGKGESEVSITPIGARHRSAKAEEPQLAGRKASPTRKKIRPISKMLETNAGKIDRPDKIIITVQAPGVKKEDVEMRRTGDTLEVIARKPSGEAHFAVFEVPRDLMLEKRKVETRDGMLIVSIPRRSGLPTRRG